MKLKPLGDRLIVRAIEEEETTASGIVLPDTAKEKPQKGKVLAVGDAPGVAELGPGQQLRLDPGLARQVDEIAVVGLLAGHDQPGHRLRAGQQDRAHGMLAKDLVHAEHGTARRGWGRRPVRAWHS